jgi:hypothetical protein
VRCVGGYAPLSQVICRGSAARLSARRDRRYAAIVRVALGVAAIAVALAFAGSGAGMPLRAHAAVSPLPLQPAPPIQPVDEAPPEDMASDWTPEPAAASPPANDSAGMSCTSNASGETCGQTCATDASGSTCTGSIGVMWSGTGSSLPVPTSAQLALLQQQEQATFDAVRPAAPPRVVAELDLGEGAHELLAAWHNAAGDVCIDGEEVDVFGTNGGNGPAGPCGVGALGIFAAECGVVCAQMLPPCSEALCLSSSDESSGDAPRYVIAGTVDARADELRVTDAAGATRAYPLSGPLVPGSTLRVFMLDLGASDWRQLELLAGGRVLDTQQMPLYEARSEECQAQVAPPSFSGWNGTTLPDQAQLQADMQAWVQAYDACLAAGGINLGTDAFGSPWPPATAGTASLTLTSGSTIGTETTASTPGP